MGLAEGVGDAEGEGEGAVGSWHWVLKGSVDSTDVYVRLVRRHTMTTTTQGHSITVECGAA